MRILPGIQWFEADSSGQYRLMLVKTGRIQVVQPVIRYWGAYFGTVRYPVPASVVNLSSTAGSTLPCPTCPRVSISER